MSAHYGRACIPCDAAENDLRYGVQDGATHAWHLDLNFDTALDFWMLPLAKREDATVSPSE